MKKLLVTLALTAVMLTAGASTHRDMLQDFRDYVSQVSKNAFRAENSWRKAGIQSPKMSPQKLITEADMNIGPVSSWGTLFTPEGEQWMYSANFTLENEGQTYETITHADFTIYDANFNVYRCFSADFALGEGETAINSVQLSSTLTKKLFDINDSYEVMVYVHATTVDYQGHNYTQVYSLNGDNSPLIETIEGIHIGSVNTAKDPWSEKFTLAFMREEIIYDDPDSEEYDPYNATYMLYFDVYSRADWTSGAKLEHTFAQDYSLISGSGNAALPFLINQDNYQVYYALPQYEKPYFVDSYTDDITPDNNFIINLYNSDFEVINTTVIPIELEDGAIFSFPGIGELYGNNDMMFDNGVFDGYIVGVENYVASSDDFITSLYRYDAQGQRIKTLVTDATDYVHLSDVTNYSDQWCFYYEEEDGGYFSMVDMPSGEEQARISVILDGEYLSFSIDRVAMGSSYKYVSSLSTADVNTLNQVIHKFAWYNADGSFDKYHRINLGENIALAMAYVNAEAFDPYLFNTDSNIEYMFIVKKYINSTGSKTNELFRIYSENNDLLLEMGPDAATGEALNSIFLANPTTNDAKLVVVYYGNYTYSIRPIALPLTKFAGGDGTAENPYLIATPGDLMSMYLFPDAYYKLANDIDCDYMPFTGNQCSFSGVLDGDGHTVSHLSLISNGIFSEMNDAAEVKNLKLENVVCSMQDDGSMGVIAAEAISSRTIGVQFTDIMINGLTATGSGSGTFGGIIGHATLHTYVTGCAIKNADIELPNADAGGIAGQIMTGTNISACYVQGSITAKNAGGIAGVSYTGDEKIENCHVDASISGNETAGGVIGNSSRTYIFTSFVEGDVCAFGPKDALAGGIAGYIKTTYAKEPPVMIENCISAAQVSTNPTAENAVAHRIAGFTSGDALEIDWNSKDPNVDWEDPSTYPYLPGSPEKCLKSNYALGVEVIDPALGEDADGPEGATITEDDLTASFFEEHNWKFGESLAKPWTLSEGLPVLYYESDTFLGVADIFVPAAQMRYDGKHVICDNQLIEIYTTSGIKIASGRTAVDTSHLTPGIYIARTAKQSIKILVK